MSKAPAPIQITHTLICGVTMSGKTTLARNYSRAISTKRPVIVHDPTAMTSTIGGDWGEKAIVFTETENFLRFVSDSKCPPADIFIDEADEVLSHELKENHWLLKRGRHYGFRLWVITQRPKLVAPTVRAQCGKAFIFRLTLDDMKSIGADFGHGDLNKYELERGEYLMLESGTSRIYRGSVFS